MNLIQEIEEYGKAAQGRSEFLKHLRGQRIVRGQVIKAKCYDCTGFYADGKQDCEIPTCPLYQYMPYRKK